MNVTGNNGQSLEIIAFKLHEQQFCVRTTTIREIRGWGPAMPVPQSPKEVMGVMNLRGSVIPVINLATKLGMAAAEPTERSAVVVAEVHDLAIGLLVDSVSDILTVSTDHLQPVPEMGNLSSIAFSDGIIVMPSGMICFLNIEQMFEASVPDVRYGT
jgi:purine-binding chemotaxis protein CheW